MPGHKAALYSFLTFHQSHIISHHLVSASSPNSTTSHVIGSWAGGVVSHTLVVALRSAVVEP